MSQLEILISRLSKVRRTTADSWQACCPAHDDKHPSLSIKETEDGKVLIHCFAGCTVHEVVAAIGLDISDLFPPREQHGKPERRPFPAADCLLAISYEALVVAAAAQAIVEGVSLPAREVERLMLAASRIQSAVTAAGISNG